MFLKDKHIRNIAILFYCVSRLLQGQSSSEDVASKGVLEYRLVLSKKVIDQFLIPTAAWLSLKVV
jgi:hypothetical protein